MEFKHRQSNKKTWIVPLIIIGLLYITIPVMLINRGSENYDKALDIINKDTEQSAKLYKTAYVFIDLAESFPGFSSWANKIKTNADKKITTIYNKECKELKNKNSEQNAAFCKKWKTFSKKSGLKLPECSGVCK